MSSYVVIPSEQTVARLQHHLGRVALQYEAFLYSMMRKLTDQYRGGLWLLREYPNGAFALVFSGEGAEQVVESATGNQSNIACSLEALSLVASLHFFSYMCGAAFEADAEEDNAYYHDLYHGLRDALIGRMSFVIDRSQEDGVRQPTEDDRQKTVAAHPELKAIMEIID